MAVWASNKIQDGGLYRVRRTATTLNLPVGWHTAPGTIRVTFSDPLDPVSAGDVSHATVKVWDLLRSDQYGSPHLHERTLPVTGMNLADDRCTLKLTIPDLTPTNGLELQLVLKGLDGKPFTRRLHATIHQLNP